MSEFDWVTARLACRAYDVYLELRSQVEKDVETREDKRPKTELHGHYAFRFKKADRAFHVIVEGHKIKGELTFEVTETQIVVSKDGNKLLAATPTISNDGECVLKVGETEYKFWQFRKLVLDDFLFHPY